MNTDNQSASQRNIQTHTGTGPPLFSLGRIVATPAALALLEKNDVQPATLLQRHVHGDWGDMDRSDRSANDASVKDGSRIFSAYLLNKTDKVWVITEAVGDDGVNRASTCILLPSEY
jgi:hypothetical protein